MEAPPRQPGPAARTRGLPLRRPRRGRLVGGVASGVAAHLALDVRVVRLAFVALTLVAGTGPALYLFLWLFVPEGDPAEAARSAQPVSGQRLSRTLQERVQAIPVKDIAVGALLLTGAVLLIAERIGYHVDVKWVLPTMIVVAGAALAWGQLDSVERGRWLSRAGAAARTACCSSPVACCSCSSACCCSWAGDARGPSSSTPRSPRSR